MADERKLRVGVIFGGRSGEHEVSLMSARSVLEAIDYEKYDVVQIGIIHSGKWVVGDNVLDSLLKGQDHGLMEVTVLPDPGRDSLYVIQPASDGEKLEALSALDVAFPVLHGTFGEDGTLQGLFELADLAYVGAGVVGSAVGMDKGVFKDVMRANGIPVVEAVIVLRSEIEANMTQVMGRIVGEMDFPVFVKPANLGSSVGVTKCSTRSDLFEGLYEAARFDRRILVERGVNAREIEVSVLGNDDPVASLPGEIIPGHEFYSYDAKYIDDSSQLLIPAPISPELTKQIQDLAVKAYRAIDCAGMARVDFLLEKVSQSSNRTPKLFLNEVNTIPGFTKISMYPKLWDASGLPYPALIDRLIELALERKYVRDRLERRYRREEG